MSVATPLLDNTIEADVDDNSGVPLGNINNSNTQTSTRAPPVVLTPGSKLATTEGDAEAGLAGIFRQSAHPLALFCLYFFRVAAITVYILSGFFTSNYVLSTVIVVVLLAIDFWNCRNVSGRTLVGLRFWNQVDDDGESYWVFESREPSRPANPVDSKMFWIAIYTFPLLWVVLLIVSFLKFSISYIPIVALALVFNLTNVIGFTYADRDSKQRWAHQVVGSSWNIGLDGIGGQLITGAIQRSVGKFLP